MANLSFAFWNFLENFYPTVFHSHLIESTDVEPEDTEGQLHFFVGVSL